MLVFKVPHLPKVLKNITLFQMLQGNCDSESERRLLSLLVSVRNSRDAWMGIFRTLRTISINKQITSAGQTLQVSWRAAVP